MQIISIVGNSGADADAAQFLEKPEMRQVYGLLYQEFAELMDKPDLAMPWPAWYDLAGTLPATVALSVPPEVLPWQLPLYMQDIRGHEGHNLSLSLQLLDQKYGRDVRIRDLAQRVTYALAGGASRIDLPLPLEARGQAEGATDEPTELFMIIRTLMTQLGGTTYKGECRSRIMLRRSSSIAMARASWFSGAVAGRPSASNWR